MKLPRDISGAEIAARLRQFGYEITRQAGSHLRVSSSAKGREHHVTIPMHKELKVGTVSAILSDVATYLEIDREKLIQLLFR